MTGRKTLQDLTIKDNFMFGAVMSVEENCIGFLELVLGIEIERIVISKEKSIVYHPEYKGVRLDIYARDEKNTHYDVEMQVKSGDALGKRARYYHSQMDMECLASGVEYEMQRTIRGIKTNREIGERYMLLQELLRDEKREGRLEATRDSVLSLLEEMGEISEELRKEIEELDNLEILSALIKKAARSESVEMFETELKKLLEAAKEK